MIVVVADDLTGAAEIAGIGLEFGLSVELTTKVNNIPQADLLVISADTRSLSEESAVTKSVQIAQHIKSLRPSFIYKKIDSVLRGHVLAEIETYMQQLQFSTALLLPGNPLLGRTIVDGHYFVKGIPVHETSFANDPEFAISSSDVLQMLKVKKESDVHIMNKDAAIKGNGIFIGDIIVNDDLQVWAAQTDDSMFLVGAANFFRAMLMAKNRIKTERDISSHQFNNKTLLVSGTAFAKSVTDIEALAAKTNMVCYMPQELLTANSYNKEELMLEWSNSIRHILAENDFVVVAFSHQYSVENNLAPQVLASLMAAVVNKVLQQTTVSELVIEGGATASAIMNTMQLEDFKPVHQFAQGVIRMQCLQKPNLFITMKPGSYDWPHSIWNFEEISKDKRN
jgi:uncharacterized protein YgbK (DUF1537 family)